jgi:hypothetical protein
LQRHSRQQKFWKPCIRVQYESSTSLPLLELAAEHAVAMLAMLKLAVAVLELAVVAVLELAVAVAIAAAEAVTSMAVASKDPMSTVSAMPMRRKLVCSISSCSSGSASS